MNESPILNESHEKTQEKAATDIDDKCTVRETHAEALRRPIRYQVPGIRAENTAKTNRQILHFLLRLFINNLFFFRKVADERAQQLAAANDADKYPVFVNHWKTFDVFFSRYCQGRTD